MNSAFNLRGEKYLTGGEKMKCVVVPKTETACACVYERKRRFIFVDNVCTCARAFMKVWVCG